MKEFADKFMNTKLQPQIFSLILVTLILVIFAIVVYRKVSKQNADKAPGGFLLVTEMYVMGVDNLYKDVTPEKLNKPAPYIFTLFSMLIVSNLFGLIGLEPPASSYSFTLTLALVSWIGIYVVGLMYHKLHFFKKFINPLELISQFSPLVSLSFRLFGNLIGGSTIMYIIYAFGGWIWGHIPVIGEFNLLGPILAPVFHGYFDIFDGLIQAFVFTLLTLVYWSLEAEVEEHSETKTSKIEKSQIKAAKA